MTHIVITRLGRAIFTTHITFPRDPALQGVMFYAVLDQNRIPSDRLGEEPQGFFFNYYHHYCYYYYHRDLLAL